MLKYIVGNFVNGAISMNSVLPVIHGSDRVMINVNAGDTLNFSVSKNDIGMDWRSRLKPVETFVALVDDSLPWNNTNTILFAGYVDKVSGSVGDVIRVQCSGLREYLASRIINPRYNATEGDQVSQTAFNANTWQGVIKQIVEHAFNTTGMPVKPRPPLVLGTVSGSNSGTTRRYSAAWYDIITYADALDDIRDSLGTGNEYIFKPRWTNSNRTNMVFDCIIQPDNAPHLRESTTVDLEIADNAWMPLSFKQTLNSQNSISIIPR